MSRFHALAVGLLILTVGTFAAAQDHPNLARGYSADQAYQLSGLDSVNLYNGNLTLAIPLGQRFHVGGNLSYGLTLYYNSNVWDYEEHYWRPKNNNGTCTLPFDNPLELHTVALPVKSSNAGLGWNLSLGSLDGPYGAQDSPNWVYTGPDGSKHAFFSTLHPWDTVSTRTTSSPSGWFCSAALPCDVFYTRDNTYLRLVALVSTDQTIQGGDLEFPDGTVQSFRTTIDAQHCNLGPAFCTNSTTAHLAKTFDPFGNAIVVSYLLDTTNNTTWQFSDGYRTQIVTFNVHNGAERVDRVDLAAFNGATATYQFHYSDDRTIVRSRKQDDSTGYCNPESMTSTVSFLSGITLPDLSSFCMNSDCSGFGGTPTYNCPDSTQGCPLNALDLPGTLSQVTLPTGGLQAWTYWAWNQDPAGGACGSGGCTPQSTCSPPGWPVEVNESCGVATRASCDQVTGTCSPDPAQWPSRWTYSHASPGQRAAAGAPNEATTTVTSPQGDDTVSYFRAQACNGRDIDGVPYGWDYGLPFTQNVSDIQNDVQLFLSTQIFRGTTATRVLVRSIYGLYATDPLDPAGSWYDSNRRLVAQRTFFHDDSVNGAATYAEVLYSSFDGLGHERTATTGGNFDSGNVRTTTVNYNPGQGPTTIYWDPNSNWVLGTFDYADTSENGVTARREACFDSSTGAALRARVLTTGTAEGSTDLLAVYANTSGNVTREQYYGGDAQTVNTGTLGSLCSLGLPTSDQYRIDHTYQYGSLQTSYYVDQNNSALPFYLVDRSIDQSTGLPYASRARSGPGSTGIQTNFSYDALGRLTSAQPTIGNGAWLRNEFTAWTPAAPTAPARVDSCAKANSVATACSHSGDNLSASSKQFDGLGRPYLATQLLPNTNPSCSAGPCWSQQVTAYDAMGRVAAVSEWQPYGTQGTGLRMTTFGYQYLSDPADPNSPKLADPFGRIGSITAADGAVAWSSYKGVREASRGETVGGQWAVTTSTTDQQGRLWNVQEPTGGAGATYGYDVGNRLVSVTMTGGATNQTRTFTYDNRGFLTQETLPELGPGTITYGTSASQPYYDARGHALRKYDGVTRLQFTFDRAERLTQVRTADGSWNPTGTLRSFGFGPSNGSGNWALGSLTQAIGTTAFDGGSAVVTEGYTYGGVAGGVSQKTTEVNVTGTAANFDRTFSQSFTWTDLGKLASQSYPSTPGITSGRTVYNTYAAGFLTGVLPYYATSITYNANATLGSVNHASGVTATQTIADGLSGRPSNWMARPVTISTSGATLPGGGDGNWSTGTYGYDGAGNITAMGGDSFGYDLLGRLTGANVALYGAEESYGYDAYGNLTTYAGRSLSTDPATNRLNQSDMSPQYDAAGNLRSWTDTGSGVTYVLSYTQMNQLSTVVGGGLNRRLAYTADGERIVVRDGQSTVLTLRGLDGRVMSDMVFDGTNWGWSKDYVYRDGLLLSSVSVTKGVVNYALDHLGSPRLVTNRCGERVRPSIYATNPFGKDPDASAQDTERMRFTVQERDLGDLTKSLDDVDNMHARDYMPYLGRFTSMDLLRGSPETPQGLNLFAYVLNNPLNKFDPFGLDDQDPKKQQHDNSACPGVSAEVSCAYWNAFGKYENPMTTPGFISPTGSPTYMRAATPWDELILRSNDTAPIFLWSFQPEMSSIEAFLDVPTFMVVPFTMLELRATMNGGGIDWSVTWAVGGSTEVAFFLGPTLTWNQGQTEENTEALALGAFYGDWAAIGGNYEYGGPGKGVFQLLGGFGFGVAGWSRTFSRRLLSGHWDTWGHP